jgi:acetyl-CoA synthetase
MKKISKKSCYYFYGKHHRTWDELRANFKWEIPKKMNAAFYLCDAHADDKGKVAIFHEDHTGKKGKITFWELMRVTNRLANYLKAKGMEQGDRVAICLAQRPETLISHLGIWKAGGVSVPLTVLFGPDALKFRLEHSDAKFAIVDSSVLDNLRALRKELPLLKEILVVDEKGLAENEMPFWKEINKASYQFDVLELSSDANMMLIYTGGTTGDPKGVIHRHSFVFHVPAHYATLLNAQIKPGDVFWNPADYAWIAPLFDCTFPAFFYGKPVLTYSSGGKFDPEKAFSLIEYYGLSILYIPPTGLRMMRQVENPAQRYDLSAPRTIFSGGESFGTALPEWVAKTFGKDAAVHEGYGQSEGTMITMNCVKYFPYKSNMGRATPGLEVEIVDDEGNFLPPGTTGEIAVRAFDGNPIVFKEYWKKPEETKKKFIGDWMLTGDLAVKDDEGYFTFVSRKDDIIISSGYRIGPSEVEDTLIKHEAVLEAGVIGVPDETRGNIPKAFVVLREGYQGTDELIKDLQKFVGTRLAKHEYPRKIEFISEIPKTTTGKVRRKDLRKLEGVI